MIKLEVSELEWIAIMFGLHQAMFAIIVIRDNPEDSPPISDVMQNMEVLASAVDPETLGKTAAELSNRLTLERRAQTGALN